MLTERQVTDIRSAVYYEQGYYVFKNFIGKSDIEPTCQLWTSNVGYQYHDFVRNTEVRPGSPNYAYRRPSESDFAYCNHIWNPALDQKLHHWAFDIQQLRNSIEGHPNYYGLHESTGAALQYRVCRSVSSGQIVHKHADFFSEYRSDPTGDHRFDPRRCQATLFLSDYGKDYTDGGFKLWRDNNAEPILFGKNVECSAGDLVIWRYSIPHEVSGLKCINADKGFLRVIFPLFDMPEGEPSQ
ncbi:MAG: 2OG-Fe(II) oxygenase [Pseudomonadota bacterium]